MPQTRGPEVIQDVRELARLFPREAGVEILVEEDHHRYYCVGNFAVPVRRALEWPHANVWMPEHVHLYLRQKRSDVFTDIVGAAAAVLEDAMSVHEDRLPGEYFCVLADASRLRERDLLTSKSVPYIDAVIDLRTVSDARLPRLFHLSPRDRNLGRKQLWP